jgi:hypothetical protein
MFEFPGANPTVTALRRLTRCRLVVTDRVREPGKRKAPAIARLRIEFRPDIRKLRLCRLPPTRLRSHPSGRRFELRLQAL